MTLGPFTDVLDEVYLRAPGVEQPPLPSGCREAAGPPLPLVPCGPDGEHALQAGRPGPASTGERSTGWAVRR